MVESVVGWLRVTVFITSDQVRSSRISLSRVIDRCCAFFLSSSLDDRVLWLIGLHCVSVCSLDWKTRICPNGKESFCLSVLSICLSVTRFFRPRWNLLSVASEWRFWYHVRSSRISLFLVIDRFCAFFSVARSIVDCCDSLDFIASLSVEDTGLRPQSISWLIVDFMSISERYFIVFMFWLAMCPRSLYGSKKLF